MTYRPRPAETRRQILAPAGQRPAAPPIPKFGGRLAGLVGLALLHLAGPGGAASPAIQATPVAVVDFDYIDTSGEARDQTDKHQDLMRRFMDQLRQDLAGSEKYRLVPLVCRPEPCSAARGGPSALLAEARRAGAALLLYGGVHKLSTLVQTAKVQVVDIRKDELVLDRNLTFRGDDDDAWRHAESFVAADLKAQDFSQ